MQLVADAFDMIRDIDRERPLIGKWGLALNLPQVIGIIFFYDRPLAWGILLASIVSVMIAGKIHRKHPFSHLTSLVHVVWWPLTPAFLQAILTTPWSSGYGLWLYYIAITMAVCLFLDTRNIWRFIFSDDHTF